MQFQGIAVRGLTVTPSDATLIGPTNGLYVGVAGNVAVEFSFDSEETAVVFVGVPAGAFLPLSVKRVRATGTTATDIIALFDS